MLTSLCCRACGAAVEHTFVDLGAQPLANSFLGAEQLDRMEPFYPLHVRVCASCFLVQLPEVHSPEAIFTDYAYFSSFSDLWLRHAREFVSDIVGRLSLDSTSQVIEIASNDGYLLQYMVERGIPSLGIEPAANCAEVAARRGIPTLVTFFGADVARRLVADGLAADLIVANNVLAHVPDLNDFVAGLSIALKPHGTATIEFPHVLRLMEERQFDTIYHEHFSYFSLLALEPVLAKQDLRIIDLEPLDTHGGSLRLYVRHASHAQAESRTVTDVRRRERAASLDRLSTYTGFPEVVAEVKQDLLAFLIEARRSGQIVVGYGAPAKGNTLLNYCGIRTDLLPYTVDRNPHKQGRFLPGVRIPVHEPDRIVRDQPDYILILPWNIQSEIVSQLEGIRSWGGRFVVPIPSLSVIE